MEDEKETYVTGNISKGQIPCSPLLYARISFVHLLDPLPVPLVDIATLVHLLFYREVSLPVIRARGVQGRQHLLGHAERDFRNVEECIIERRGGKLVVPGEGTGVDVEALGARVGYHYAWDGSSGVVDS